jgi:3-oxoacyl-[acyl-carrier-protein] synthase III
MKAPPVEERIRRIIEDCFLREAGAAAQLPDDTADLLECGALDSMGWVSFVRGIESASGAPDLGARLAERTPSLMNILEVLRDGIPATELERPGDSVEAGKHRILNALCAGSAPALGSRTVPSEEVDRAFGMPEGKLRARAGIESLAYVSDDESELTLGAAAMGAALQAGGCGAQEVDWIVATSETHHDYPSLAAQLHSRLLVRENCGALDVGGACLGLFNAMQVAQAMIGAGQAKAVAVVSADVHSRTLRPGRVPGEFGGLFGDGASAFLLRAADSETAGYRLRSFLFGCAGQYASAIRVSDAKDGGLELQFDGEALSRAAITRMEKVISAVELRSGISRREVGGFATHQPNPRLVTLLAKQCGVSPEVFPAVARTAGNLGPSTCGVALHKALEGASETNHKPIFLASLGPGLVFGGGWLEFAKG